MLRENTVPQSEDGWRKLHIEKPLDLSFSTSNIMVIKSGIKRLFCHVALWVEYVRVQNIDQLRGGKERRCET